MSEERLIQDPFATCIDPTPVIDLPETGSTNAEAARLAANGETGPLWVTARRQTAGRGRDGRSWTSVEGNLHASLLVTLWADVGQLPQQSLLAGAALAEAVKSLPAYSNAKAPAPTLKWPNDLLFDQAKCAGILVETSAMSNSALNCILGFGVNIETAPSAPGRQVTSLEAQNIETTPSDLLMAIDREVRKGMAILAAPHGFQKIKAIWTQYAHAPGTRITVNTGSTATEGEFAGLDDDGALLLRDETGSLRRITHGDVSAARPVV